MMARLSIRLGLIALRWRVARLDHRIHTHESTPMNDTKSIFQSKTAAVNLLVMLSTLYPPVGNVVATHPEVSILVLGLLNLGLRVVTKKRVTLFPGE
jgi:hypothetical protein